MKIGNYLQTVQYSYPSISKIDEKDGYSSKKDTAAKNTNEQLETSRIISELKNIDRKVKSHESAHIAAGGDVVKGSATYKYTKGPDGHLYAVGGEVPIDTSKENNPEETITKMEKVIAAALAPADPSPQDLKVAAIASQRKNEALAEYQKYQQNTSQKHNISFFI